MLANQDHRPGIAEPGCRCILLALALAASAAPPSAAATILVNSTADGTNATDGLCTLHEAAIAVNSDTASGAVAGECVAGEAGVDVVTFALPAGSTIGTFAAPFVFDQSVEINGPGADLLSIRNISGLERVLVFEGALEELSFTLRDLTVERGAALNNSPSSPTNALGGGLLVTDAHSLRLSGVRIIDSHADLSGGGAYIDLKPGGSAIIEDTEFRGNDAASTLGLGGGGGGGLFLGSVETTTIRRCLFVDNEAGNAPIDDADGGALGIAPLITGTLTIDRSTFSGNRAFGVGGAIAFGNTSTPSPPDVTATLRNLTITGNTADADGDSLVGDGGGIWTGSAPPTAAATILRNSIVAGNFDASAAFHAPDLVVASGAIVSSGYNWIGVESGAAFPDGQPNGNEDWIGTSASPLDPELDALAENGGPTRSHMPHLSPLPLSPVIDGGSCPNQLQDQRGWFNEDSNHRIFDEPTVVNFDDGCDIGSIEAFLVAPTTIFENGFESGDLTAWSSSEQEP